MRKYQRFDASGKMRENKLRGLGKKRIFQSSQEALKKEE